VKQRVKNLKKKDVEKEEKLEHIRDEAEEVLRQVERTWALRHGLADASTFNPEDLGIKRALIIQQARDGGIVGEDIQNAINKLEDKSPPSKAKLFVSKALSEGFYSYLKLRRLLGIPKDSFRIGPIKGGLRLPDCMGLVNPGGLVWIKEGTYPIAANLALNVGVGLEAAGVEPAIVQASASLSQMILANKVMWPRIREITFDCNNLATYGIDYRDSWHSDIKAKILNVPTGGIGLRVQTDDINWSALYNRFWIRTASYTYLNNPGTKDASAIGVKFDSSVYPSNEPNFNMLSGLIYGFNYGVYINYGNQQLLRHLDSGANNYGHYINTYENILLDCYCEGNVNPSIITKNGKVILIGGQWDAYPTVQADATKSGHLMILDVDNITLTSQYNATSIPPTPAIKFVVGGNYALKIEGRGDGEVIQLTNLANSKPSVKIWSESGSGGKAGKVMICRGSDEYELGSLIGGSSGNRPVLKFWDVTKSAYYYAYIDNGAWVVSSSCPT
jgi:hypothetical protein